MVLLVPGGPQMYVMSLESALGLYLDKEVRFDDKSAKKFATMMRNLFPHYKETVLQKKKWEK